MKYITHCRQKWSRNWTRHPVGQYWGVSKILFALKSDYFSGRGLLVSSRRSWLMIIERNNIQLFVAWRHWLIKTRGDPKFSELLRVFNAKKDNKDLNVTTFRKQRNKLQCFILKSVRSNLRIRRNHPPKVRADSKCSRILKLRPESNNVIYDVQFSMLLLWIKAMKHLVLLTNFTDRQNIYLTEWRFRCHWLNFSFPFANFEVTSVSNWLT